MDADESSSLERRTVLSSAAAALALGPAVATAGATPSLTVMTRNLYLGVDLSAVRDVESSDELRDLAGTLLARARRHPYDERVGAIAGEIATREPDVVALQEAVRIRTRRADGSDDDWTTEVDVLELLADKLASRGAGYRVAASTVTTGAELAASTDDGDGDLSLVDRDAVLVRSGLEVADARSGTFDVGLTYSLPDTDREIRLARCYCLLTLEFEGRAVTVANTHLESVSSIIRRLQAEELLSLLPSSGPVVLAGDFNSGPGRSTATYDRLTGPYADAWTAVGAGTDGFTCCQRSSLRNEASRLDERIDGVLFRGGLRAATVDVVGNDPGDRVPVERDDESFAVWPSDHAGVVATFEAEWSTPTDVPTTRGTASAEPTAATATASPTAATDAGTARNGATPTAAANPAGSPGERPPDRGPGESTSDASSPSDERMSAATGSDRSPSTGTGPGYGPVGAVVGIALTALARRYRA